MVYKSKEKAGIVKLNLEGIGLILMSMNTSSNRKVRKIVDFSFKPN